MRPVIFGEVLFDVFPDGNAVLGGAPFNVAWNLRGFGFSPLFISRIGKDERGDLVLQVMLDWGMDVGGIQVDPDRPTGIVQVSLKEGQPTFDILADQAYDFIDPVAAGKVVRIGPFPLFYNGTLITRSETSRSTLETLRTNTKLPTFVDVNLRPPWWNLDGVIKLLSGVDWVKLNGDEFTSILGKESFSDEGVFQEAQQFLDQFSIKMLIVTLGATGAILVTPDFQEKENPVALEDVVDTVGAGDAFSSVCILGTILDWPPRAILQRAVSFAGEICRVQGATLKDQSIYDTYLKQWDVES